MSLKDKGQPEIEILSTSVCIQEGDPDMPLVVSEADMGKDDNSRNGGGKWSNLLQQLLRELGIVGDRDVVCVSEAEEGRTLRVDEIVWGDESVSEEILVDVDGEEKDRVVSLDDEQRINFAVWQQEQNEPSARLFFVNLRSNIQRMMRESIGQEATLRYPPEYYLNDNYVDVQDFLLASNKWGVPMAIHSPGNHAALVLKIPEFDQDAQRWKVLVYDPLIGGEDWRWLDKMTGVRPTNVISSEEDKLVADDVIILSEVDKSDDPINNAAAYGLVVNPNNENFMRLWQDGSYDLSVKTDQVVAQQPDVEREKQRKVQYDLNNCVLASGHMAVIRAFLKYPELFDLKKRADIYKDTGVIYHLRNEVLRKVKPLSVEELVAAGGVGD